MNDQSLVLSVLQNQMDRATSEQFWAVASVTGLNALIISEKTGFLEAYSPTIISSFLIVVGIPCAIFVWIRHISYYINRNDMANVLEEAGCSISRLTTVKSPFAVTSLPGVTVYLAWIIVMTVAGVAAMH